MSFDYKKAEELKAAGFPQRCPQGEFYWTWIKTHTFVPGLGDLMWEVEKFDLDKKLKLEGSHKGRNYKASFLRKSRTGEDASEALANLWLHLKSLPLSPLEEDKGNKHE